MGISKLKIQMVLFIILASSLNAFADNSKLIEKLGNPRSSFKAFEKIWNLKDISNEDLTQIQEIASSESTYSSLIKNRALLLSYKFQPAKCANHLSTEENEEKLDLSVNRGSYLETTMGKKRGSFYNPEINTAKQAGGGFLDGSVSSGPRSSNTNNGAHY